MTLFEYSGANSNGCVLLIQLLRSLLFSFFFCFAILLSSGHPFYTITLQIFQMEAINWSNEWIALILIIFVSHLAFKRYLYKSNCIKYYKCVFPFERYNKCIYLKFKSMSFGMHFSIDFIRLCIVLHKCNIWYTFIQLHSI